MDRAVGILLVETESTKRTDGGVQFMGGPGGGGRGKWKKVYRRSTYGRKPEGGIEKFDWGRQGNGAEVND